MIKRFTLVLILAFVSISADAGLITRTYSYTSGNTISANENNTNENTLYNEINGNLSTANILDGTIQNGDIADTQIAVTKFATAVQSTFTYVMTMGSYHRPNLQYISGTQIDVTSNTGTSFQTCVQFPDEQRCVTENTGSTDKYRRLVITATATYKTGTEDSGASDTGWPKANTWGAVYAVKSQISASNYILAITTNTPIQTSYAELNTMYGTNGWVYLGMIRVGDGASITTVILNFVQGGNKTRFLNTATGSSADGAGIRLANSASGTSLSYAFSGGTGATSIPTHIPFVQWTATSGGGGTGTISFLDAGQVRTYGRFYTVSATTVFTWESASIDGAKELDAGSTTHDIFLAGFTDGVLGLGYNPQL